MATAKILLIKPVENLGDEGDQVTVKAGYARNFLLPSRVAVPLTSTNRKQVEVLKQRAEQRRMTELEHARKLGDKITSIAIAIAVKTGPGGKMFGSVTAQELIQRLGGEGVELDRKQVTLTPVKTLGPHSAEIRLHPEVSVEFPFEVVSENPIEEIEGEPA